MIYNNAPLAFEVTSWTKTNIKTAIQFSTQDINTARLIFSLTKDGVPLPLSAVTGKLVMFMADGSRFIKNVEIVDKVEGIAEHVLSPEEIRHYGDVQAELNLYYENKQALSVHKFSFTIDKALIDTDIIPIAEYYIDDFEALIAKVNELYDEAIETIEELRKKFEDLENIETKEGAQEKADKALSDSKAYTDEHADRTDNPHSVTKDQIGLNNVDNVKQAPLDQFRAHDTNGIRHISQAERDKWNGGQLKKLTDDQGKYLVSIQDGLDFHKIVDELDQSFFFYTSNTGVNVPSLSTRGIYIGFKTYGEALAMDYAGGTWRKTLKASGWTDWIQIETSDGAQKKVDAHANKTDIHVTQSDKNKWNASQIAKLTKDDGKRTQLANETDILALSSGFYYASGTLVKNNPVANDTAWFNYDVIEGDSGRKSIIAWRSHDNTLWHTTVHTDGVFKGWKRIVTSTDFESNEWREPTLKNGWTNYTDSSNGDQTQYKVRYSKDAAGTVSVEGAMAKGTVGSGVVAFVLPEGYRPGRAFQWLGVSSQIGMNGIPQYHRLLVEVNGQVIIESCSNTQRPNEYISLGFQFKAG
ncbi:MULTISPECIES: phage baseplate upper protein [Bacillus amyloliquefaciens group]|uniref:phage baseplate upper protein n=1 Tax=Bacillus amyloliquefaciens group TaxID=1938374 RepID=UPI002280AACA|nr:MULTISPECIES: phage baseplate upper protein [Bacillus amyloliquefaciens group]MCY7423547.1 phage baseplate upper protein [Bacillus amyloliquefaciens]MEC0966154.1 phage baseplate upper protein [Bacillus amyloliquefaciens]MEC1012945.1 phage baseplate upper protein [Bacillus amyloliquefaciens]